MNWKKIKVLIGNTINKEYRNKGLIFLFIFTLLILFLINSVINFFVNPLSEQGIFLDLSARKMTIFYLVIFVWNGMLSTVLSVNALRSDFEHGVAAQILSLPIRSVEYLFSRMMGTWLIVVLYYFISILIAYFLFGVANGSAVIIPIIKALSLNALAILVTVTLGILFSLFMPKIFALMSTIFFSSLITFSNRYVANFEWKGFIDFLQNKWRIFVFALHYIFPRPGNLNEMASEIASNSTLSLNLWNELGHFALTYSLLFALLVIMFNWRKSRLI